MKSKKLLSGAFALLLLASCTKQSDQIESTASADATASKTSTSTVTSAYTTYTISAGQHYCDKSSLKAVSSSEMKFSTKLDSSAIYQTVDPVNQYDINKLYGFSEGLNHEYNSARIGWGWSDGALRLYAYAYNNGVRESQEITQVPIGQDISCSIKLSGYSYVFTVNGVSVSLARAKNTATASGYQLYPYFGGDEAAPHTISIQIKNL